MRETLLSSFMPIKAKPTVVDLFSGAGLLSHAFVAEGFQVLRAVEFNPIAAETYRLNLGDHVEVADVREAHPAGRCDVLVAGPPCQGFSTLGKRDVRDSRNLLSLEVLRWAKVLKPEIVVVENVAAFLESPVWGRLASGLRRVGYTVHAASYNAYDFGAPQIRHRSLTVASRGGSLPVSRWRRTGTVTVREAWSGLPARPDGRNHHYAPRPSPFALARMRLIPAGGDKRDIMRRAPKLAAPSWWRVPGDVTDVWGRMEWERPSNTLRTALLNPSKGRYIHPEQHRVISLREAARLHTIPDRWVFAGWPTHVAMQIGNSVPPALGRAVARSVRAGL